MNTVDTQIIADQERTIARMRAEIAHLSDVETEAFNHAVERFNPPDDDSTTIESMIDTAADFIESLPCDCTPEQIEDLDSCDRCRVLGRRGDVPVSR